MTFFKVLFVSLFALPLWGQNPNNNSIKIGSVDGTILDSISKKPVEYASVRICKVEDSSVVSGIYTDEKGFFVLEQLPSGKFFARITQLDYKEKFIGPFVLTPQKPLKKLGTIGLVSNASAIEEIVVTGKKQVLQSSIDKKVYNVGEDISVQGGTANDVLNNIPSIEIDQDGKLSLRGDGNVTILIDGRPSTLGKAALDGISASSIDRIEVVTNPGAKYDPDGTSGIINIVLKKNIRRGINGNVNLSAATGNTFNGSTALSLRNTKFNLYGNVNSDYRDGFRNNYSTIDQRITTDSIVGLNQVRLGQDLSKNTTAKIGMDLYVKDRNTVFWSLAGNVNNRTRLGDQVNYRTINRLDTIQNWNRFSSDPSKRYNADANLGWNHEFDKEKGTLDLTFSQSLSAENNEGFYFQEDVFPISPFVQDQTLSSKENNSISTLSFDIVRQLPKEWRLETGLKGIHRNMVVNTNSASRINTALPYQPDTLAFFNYAYTERIYSAYGTMAKQWNKFKYQFGVRLEQSYQEPRLISKKLNYSNDYFNIFPSGFVRYQLAKKSELSLGYSKRINRPNAENLNPFTSYADPFNLRRGNPALRPEYIHSVDLGIDVNTQKWSFTGSIYHRIATNVIQRVKIFYADGISAGTFANVDQSQSTGTEVVIQYRPLPIWRNVLSGNTNYIVYTDKSNESNFNRSGFVVGGKFSSTLDLMKKTLTLQLNARYNAPGVSAQGKFQPRGSVDFSADKSLDGGKWGIGMRVSDIFNTQGFNFEVDQPNIYQVASFKWQTRRIYVSIRYKFGRTDFNTEKKKGNDAPQSGGGGGFEF